MTLPFGKLSRRRFLATAGAGTLTLTWQPHRSQGAEAAAAPVRFGVVADVHRDVMHDANERLTAFVDAMQRQRPDFAIQMGDFCIPIPENDSFMDVWSRLAMPRYHVLGNHDMDGVGKHRPDKSYAFRREETMEYWGMKARYYSFDIGNVHAIVLDGNDRGPGQQPYYRYVADDQAQWLASDLAGTERTTILFIHQSLERPDGGVENQAAIRKILEQANRRAGYQKVVACFTAHHHRDYVQKINGIYYPQINSMSYHWLGGKYQHVRYSEEIDARFPYIKYTVPYRDPLYALVTVDTAGGKITIRGRKSEFVGPSPWKLGADEKALQAKTLVPAIADRTLDV